MELLDGPGTLAAWLMPRLKDAAEVAISTGWLSASGIAKVQRALTGVLDRGGQVTIVANMSGELTDVDAARSLAELAAEFPGQATVCLVREDVFQHGKAVYVRDRDGRAAAYVGSANLTGPGLDTNHETGVAFGDGEPIVPEVRDSIMAWRRHPAAEPVTPDIVRVSTRPLAELLPGALDEIEAAGTRGGQLTGVPTGIADLDALTNGLHPGQLVVLAGRPGLGKSVLALGIARTAAIGAGLTTAIFSLEMSHNEITTRLLSAEARVPLYSIRNGMMDEAQWTRLAQRMTEVADAPLFVEDWPKMPVSRIRAICRSLRQQHDLRLVIIDYLQLMASPARAQNRELAVAEISRSLKLLAKELGVPVVAVSQLNRGPEQRVDKRPLLADLRESGALEQDSDLVILIHREDAYDPESPRAGEADLIVAKHRNGPTATVTVAFQGHYARFVDMASYPPSSSPEPEPEAATVAAAAGTDPRILACPTCGAAPGDPCTYANGCARPAWDTHRKRR
jgi:DnaB-like helicase C terminal domain/PLD-like domain